MPEVDIQIGGRVFQVACQEGEEHFLRSAAQLLDNEAQSLADALGRVPETRMLLMAGLMLADKTAGLEEELRVAESKAQTPAAPAQVKTETVQVHVEVPVIPPEVGQALAKLAAEAEAVAAKTEAALAP